jgi:hypothetical protein
MSGAKTFHAERAEPYYPRDDQPLIAFSLPHADMVARFGSAHRLMDAEDDEPGPAEYWSFRFPCGLVTFITYHFHTPPAPGGTVRASSPDIEHILRHLPVADCLFWRLDRDLPDFFRERYGTVSGTCSHVANSDGEIAQAEYPATRETRSHPLVGEYVRMENGDWKADVIIEGLDYPVCVAAPGPQPEDDQIHLLEELVRRMPRLICEANFEEPPSDDGYGNSLPPFDIRTARVRFIRIETEGGFSIIFDVVGTTSYALSPLFTITAEFEVEEAIWSMWRAERSPTKRTNEQPWLC